MYKIMETPDNVGIKLFVLAVLKTHYFEYLSIFFPLSTLYSASGNALNMVCSVNVLQNGKLERFSKRTDCLCAFRWSISNKNSPLFGVSIAAVSKVMMAHTNHWKTSSAKRISGRKLKLSDRDRHTSKTIV